MSWQEIYKSKLVSQEEAVSRVSSGDRVYYSIAGSAPLDLINALSRRLPELGHITFISGILFYNFDYLMKPEYKDHFTHYSLFYFNGERASVNQESIEPLLFHFHNTPAVLMNQVKPNVLMCECPPPDKNGYLNFGCFGVFCNNTVASMASKIIVQVNNKAPYVHGEQNLIHVSEVDCIVENDHELGELIPIPITDVESQIARYLVERIEDGSTIQIGVGGLSGAVASFLDSKKDLGIYTEALADVFVDLIEKGVITGAKKSFLPGEFTCSFGANSRAAYDFVHNNPMVKYYPIDYINDPNNIAKNDNLVSINNALMVDLTGQVGAESIGFRQYSASGGQVDFVRGAVMAKNGQSFITLPSMAKGNSTISLTLPPGQIVTTPRNDVDKVVTEYGVAELRNRTIRERVREMIKIAHPQFRDELLFGAQKAGLL